MISIVLKMNSLMYFKKNAKKNTLVTRLDETFVKNLRPSYFEGGDDFMINDVEDFNEDVQYVSNLSYALDNEDEPLQYTNYQINPNKDFLSEIKEEEHSIESDKIYLNESPTHSNNLKITHQGDDVTNLFDSQFNFWNYLEPEAWTISLLNRKTGY